MSEAKCAPGEGYLSALANAEADPSPVSPPRSAPASTLSHKGRENTFTAERVSHIALTTNQFNKFA
jgi:hypothetical protein